MPILGQTQNSRKGIQNSHEACAIVVTVLSKKPQGDKVWWLIREICLAHDRWKNTVQWILKIKIRTSELSSNTEVSSGPEKGSKATKVCRNTPGYVGTVKRQGPRIPWVISAGRAGVPEICFDSPGRKRKYIFPTWAHPRMLWGLSLPSFWQFSATPPWPQQCPGNPGVCRWSWSEGGPRNSCRSCRCGCRQCWEAGKQELWQSKRPSPKMDVGEY